MSSVVKAFDFITGVTLFSPANLTQKLLDTFSSCTHEERTMLQLLSLLYAPLSKNVLLNVLRRLGVPAPEERSYTGLVLAEVLEKLAHKKLVVQGKDGIRCDMHIAHAATLSAVADGAFPQMVSAIHAEIPMETDWGSSYYRTQLHALRDVRIAFYAKDERLAFEMEARFKRQFPYDLMRCHPFVTICTAPFDLEWFRSLPLKLQGAALKEILSYAGAHLLPAQPPFALLAELAAAKGVTQELYDVLCVELLLRGEIDAAEKASGERASSTEAAVFAATQMLRGAYPESAASFESALALLRKETGKRKTFFDNITGPLYILALIAAGDERSLTQAADFCAFVVGKKDWPHQDLYLILKHVAAERNGERGTSRYLEALSAAPAFDISPFYALFCVMALQWGGSEKAREKAAKLPPLARKARDAGYLWLADELEWTALECGIAPLPASRTGKREKQKGVVPLVHAVAKIEFWQTALQALIRLNREEEEAEQKPVSQSRLIWHFDEKRGYFEIHPREQKQAPNGKWSSGRNISLKRLAEDAAGIDFLTEQDRLICACIKLERCHGYYGRDCYELNHDLALPLMVGHPQLYLDPAGTVHLELVRGEPEIQLTTEGDALTLQITPQFAPDQKTHLQKETPTRLKVYQVKEEYRRIAAIVGGGLKLPAKAKKQALEAIHSLSALVTVHSDIDDASTEQIASDSTPCFHLLPYQAGLRLELLVCPLSEGGPCFRPGAGGETLMAVLEGKKVQAKRDLQFEVSRAAEAVAALPVLSESEEWEGEWLVPSTEKALELLLELQGLGETVRVSWPEGARFKIKQVATPGHCRLVIKQAKDWFELEGEVKLNEGLSLDLRQLVELAKDSPGRFIRLANGDFLALSAQLKKHLDDLASCADPHGSSAFRFHPLAAPVFEEFTGQAGSFDADEQWRCQLKRLLEAEAFRPQLPATLQAELRGYQEEGFNWLNRLAHWGVGACLADDMGLGKTVQALAQILSMAEGGPSLVVAPTSVCLNWESEALKFAPTLNPIIFGGQNRARLLQELKPFDLVICSYGLLQQEGELLAAVQWQAIVLDEAQAIKNMATKRSQAAMELKGAFKMVATGTPIENHLGELWNVFRFINPGLLGSLKQFNVKFAAPIEKSQDKKARARLKKLIQPFILRRTKNQVLEELPSRTEIVIKVEMSEEEASLYEAIRKSALDNLAGVGKVEGKGELHLKILAEIMRLRRACCNPRLVLPDTPIPSTKLAAFGEIVEELRENRHKALVFSQFVGHLELIRQYVEKNGIPYQYLDGSTPPQERKKRVDAFQSGSGDLFLISLKAGGVGLNLTAADYVIHMDPWWNPAVEDQASDRAHRIGQQRPVTIYRLVTRGTIEEKIVGLHQQKRGLADSLLDESDLSGKISAEELLVLLRK
ncbi:helicase SNF2 [Geoanaerobacter pelophilus]|uniref:Helicase SNF2 n=1 Tax=Geoanaerobacter pelophilus TaxID=60036 RepID=A0ABQ0MG21_9BACT|nr:helicase SNF2 [Geoanaerobacter pelophilus]